MRDEIWWLIYFAFAASVIGLWWLSRRDDERVREVRERAARLTPVPAQRHPLEPRRRPVGATVYWSKEAIRRQVIDEYESSRPTVMRMRHDPVELARVWSLARRVGQNDGRLDAEAASQDHEPTMSRDLDMACYPMLRDVTKLRPNTSV